MTSSTHRDRGAVALDSLAALFIVSLLVSAFLTTIAKAAKASAGQVANTQAEILASELAGKAEAFSCAAATGTEPLFSEATSATACTAKPTDATASPAVSSRIGSTLPLTTVTRATPSR